MTTLRVASISALLTLMFVCFYVAPQAYAFKDGQITCQFDVVAKDTFPKVEKLAPFTFDLKEPFFDGFQATSLKRRLLFSYSPGFSAPGDVNLLILDLKYDGANAGADVPAVADGLYTVKISRDDSDLVGAFLNCNSKLK